MLGDNVKKEGEGEGHSIINQRIRLTDFLSFAARTMT